MRCKNAPIRGSNSRAGSKKQFKCAGATLDRLISQVVAIENSRNSLKATKNTKPVVDDKLFSKLVAQASQSLERARKDAASNNSRDSADCDQPSDDEAEGQADTGPITEETDSIEPRLSESFPNPPGANNKRGEGQQSPAPSVEFPNLSLMPSESDSADSWQATGQVDATAPPATKPNPTEETNAIWLD
eukprot:c15934_g1_i2.p2 GENE.c15934_g1_i2~~c15934_g1_i2.p2  ORF type:complete len:189 (+),score=42.18 c15934_g1_i2:769-1335(+)